MWLGAVKIHGKTQAHTLGASKACLALPQEYSSSRAAHWRCAYIGQLQRCQLRRGCNDRKSTRGFVFILGSSAISWFTKEAIHHHTVLHGGIIHGTYTCDLQGWLHALLCKLGAEIGLIDLRGNNMESIGLLCNPKFHVRTKNIDVMYHYVREEVLDGMVTITYIPTRDIVADVLIKALPHYRHTAHSASMGGNFSNLREGDC